MLATVDGMAPLGGTTRLVDVRIHEPTDLNFFSRRFLEVGDEGCNAGICLAGTTISSREGRLFSNSASPVAGWVTNTCDRRSAFCRAVYRTRLLPARWMCGRLQAHPSLRAVLLAWADDFV